MKIRAYLFILAMVATLPVAAQDEASNQDPTVEPSPVQWSLGLGVTSSPRPYVGASNSVLPIPVVELYYKNLYIQGIQAGYHFVNTKNFAFDVRAGLVAGVADLVEVSSCVGGGAAPGLYSRPYGGRLRTQRPGAPAAQGRGGFRAGHG